MYRHIFGPVNSRRLGISLGIDLLNKKICSYNCVYCEVKKTELLTTKREPFIKASIVNKEIDSFIKANPNIHLDYITFSGKGEPTLNSEIAKVIKHIKRYYSYPICVLTNGSLLHLKSVRKDLLGADLIIPSIDAVSDDVFKVINRPSRLIDINKMFYGIKVLRQEFKKEMWLEILFVKGVNDSKKEVDLLKEKVKEIKPDRVCINTIYRPPAFDEYLPVDHTTIEKLQFEFDSILDISSKKVSSIPDMAVFSSTDKLSDELVNMLSIRPCTFEDIYNVFYSSDSSMTKNMLEDILTNLVKSKKLFTKEFTNSKFYYSS